MVVRVALGAGNNADSDALSDLGDTSATLPIDYVLALMALFGLMVADRTVSVAALCEILCISLLR